VWVSIYRANWSGDSVDSGLIFRFCKKELRFFERFYVKIFFKARMFAPFCPVISYCM
jgi:hypothetical protein